MRALVLLMVVVALALGGCGLCCKECTSGKPCGDICIPNSDTCHLGPGCAC